MGGSFGSASSKSLPASWFNSARQSMIEQRASAKWEAAPRTCSRVKEASNRPLPRRAPLSRNQGPNANTSRRSILIVLKRRSPKYWRSMSIGSTTRSLTWTRSAFARPSLRDCGWTNSTKSSKARHRTKMAEAFRIQPRTTTCSARSCASSGLTT